MKKITVSILTTLLMLSMVFSSSVFAANEKVSAWDSFLGLFGVKATETSDVGVEYRGHVENKGDFPLDGTWIQGPNRLGTVGEGLRLEAFWIKLAEDAPEGLHIKYQVHVQNKGWMGFVNDGAMAGTEGQGLRIEAIQISLVDDEGDIADGYSVEYRGHVQNIGDTAWYADGAQLGTTGSGLRLEALEIKIVQTKADMTAYEAVLAAVEEADYTKASWSAYQAVVAANVVTEDNTQAEVDAATEAIMDAQEDLVLEPVVTAVAATNSKTLTVTGKALFNLAAADITVADNTVVSFVGSADGMTGTVVLGSDLVVDEVTNVTIKGIVYPVTYKVEFSTLEVVAATYDDDTANQSVAITMDGGKAITAQELINAGYALSFNVYSNKSGTTAVTGFFANSNTGALVTDLNTSSYGAIPTAGADFYVTVQAIKGSTVTSSTIGTIKVKNINVAADSITASRLLNYGNDKAVGGGDDFVQNSRTLRTGEVAVFNRITVTAGTESENVVSGYTVKSSNTAVVSVATNGELTAQSPGTATITISYGAATRTETITVTNAAREASRVTVKSNNLTVAKNASVSTDISLVDQFGDPMAATINVINSDTAGLIASDNGPINTVLDVDAPAQLTFTGIDAGTLTATFTNADGIKIGSTAVRVTVVANDTLAKYALTVDSSITDDELTALTALDGTLTSKDQVSKDTIMDGLSDAFIKLDIAGQNSSNIVVSDQQNAAGDYDATFAQSRSGVLDTTNPIVQANGYVLIKAGSATGTATITITNKTNGTIVKSITVSVEQVGYNVTGTTFKAIEAPTYVKTLTYKDALTFTESANDPIISGITLTKATSHPIRLDVSATIGRIYIDKDANGLFSLGDIPVGTLEMTTTGTIDKAPIVSVLAGVETTAGDDGSILYKVVDNNSNVVAVKEVVVNF
jgi:uncharacterized protein YjdB